MRFIAVLGVLFLAFAAAAPATAHEGGHAEHLSVRVDDLEPGQNRTLFLSFEGGDFAAGWIFFVYGSLQSQEAVLDLELRTPDNETVVAAWTWTPGAFHLNSTRLPETGEYLLWLSNPHDSESLRYAFYFDQSCECSNKTIGLPGGWGIFNLKAPADRKINFTLGVYHFDTELGGPVEAEDVRVRATAAHLVDERAHWPQDFENVTSDEATDAPLYLEWETDEQGAQYIWVEVVEGASTQRPVFLFPKIDHEAVGGDAAGPAFLLTLSAIVAVFATFRARQN